MSTENLFKTSNRKDCRGVVLAKILESVQVLEFLWIAGRPTHIAFAILVAEKSAMWAVYMLWYTKKNRKSEENPSREAEKVPAKSKGAGKRLFCDRTPTEQWHIQHATQSTDLRVMSCGTRKIKGEINLYIELQEHIKLDQIAARSIRISLDKPIASSK